VSGVWLGTGELTWLPRRHFAESPRNRRQRRVAEKKLAAARSMRGGARAGKSAWANQSAYGAENDRRRAFRSLARSHRMPADPASVTRNAAFEAPRARFHRRGARSLFTSRGARNDRDALVLSLLSSGALPSLPLGYRPLGSSVEARGESRRNVPLMRSMFPIRSAVTVCGES